MKKLSAALLLYLGLASAALAQVVSWPPPAGSVAFLCVYNTSPPTLSTTNVGFVQCDSSGRVLTASSGGGAVTIADGADVAEGATTDAASVAGGIGTVSAKLRLMTTQLGTINTTLGSPLQAGGTVVVTGVATAANQTTMATNQTVVQTPVAPATATATKGELIGCQYNSTNLAFTNGQQGQIGCDQRGGLYVQDGQAIASVSVTSATTLFTVADTSGYGSISVQVTSAGSASTITYEVNEDGINWFAVNGYSPTSNTTAAQSSTSTAVGINVFPLYSKQFRARVSTYGSGTVTVQGTLKKDPLPRLAVNIPGGVAGSVADGSGTSVSSIGVSFEGRTSNKAAVTNGTYVRPVATSIGAAVNKPFQVPELDWSYPAAAGGISNTTTAVTMVAAAGSGIRNYLTAIQVSAGALGAASEIAVRDGAGGTVIWRGFISTAGGNQSVNLSSPIKSTANTLLEVVTLTATITGAVYINAQGYQAP